MMEALINPQDIEFGQDYNGNCNNPTRNGREDQLMSGHRIQWSG